MNQFMMKVRILRNQLPSPIGDQVKVTLYEPDMQKYLSAWVLPEEAKLLSTHKEVVVCGSLRNRWNNGSVELVVDRPQLIFCTGGVGFLYANVSHSLSDSMAVVIVDPPGRPNQHEGRKFVLVHKALVDAKRGQRLLAVYHPTGIDRLGAGQMPRIFADEVYLEEVNDV